MQSATSERHVANWNVRPSSGSGAGALVETHFGVHQETGGAGSVTGSGDDFRPKRRRRHKVKHISGTIVGGELVLTVSGQERVDALSTGNERPARQSVIDRGVDSMSTDMSTDDIPGKSQGSDAGAVDDLDSIDGVKVFASSVPIKKSGVYGWVGSGGAAAADGSGRVGVGLCDNGLCSPWQAR